ncbi:MAG: acyl-CoA desaturase [Planctomycetota bacterium]
MTTLPVHDETSRPHEVADSKTRIAVLAAVILPFVALAFGIWLAWGRGFDWWQLSIVILMYLLSGLGVTLGYHRLFTHGSFKAARPVEAALGVMAGMAAEGPLLWWVATHRKHHQHSDREHDPHSPHAALPENAGWMDRVRCFAHAHVGWLIADHHVDIGRYAPDLAADRMLNRISKLFPLWVVLGLALPAALGWLVEGPRGALLGFLWGGLARIALLHHITWSINSVCHVWGSKPYRSGDESRNNAIMGLLGFGEGWHNNHHAFPTSARHGLEWWQFDLSWLCIRALERLGLIWKVRVPSAERLRERQV